MFWAAVLYALLTIIFKVINLQRWWRKIYYKKKNYLDQYKGLLIRQINPNVKIAYINILKPSYNYGYKLGLDA